MVHVLSSTVITACVVALTVVSCAKKETPISVVRTTDNHFVFMLPDADKPGHFDRAIAVFFKEQPPIANLPATLPAGTVDFSDVLKDAVVADYGKGMVIFGIDQKKTIALSQALTLNGQVRQTETYEGYGISETHGDWVASKVTAAGALDLLTLVKDMNEGLPLAQR